VAGLVYRRLMTELRIETDSPSDYLLINLRDCTVAQGTAVTGAWLALGTLKPGIVRLLADGRDDWWAASRG
jgi:hypothetical protein